MITTLFLMLKVNMFYHNGEPITAPTMQDEEWYSDFSSFVSVKCVGPDPSGLSFYERLPNGEQAVLDACKKYFKKCPGPPGWIAPDDARLLRWIRATWMSEEVMSRIEEIDRTEDASKLCQG